MLKHHYLYEIYKIKEEKNLILKSIYLLQYIMLKF